MTKKKTQIGWKCPHCGGRYGYYKGANDKGICDVYCEKKVEAGKWIPLYEEAEACHSWREEFEKNFIRAGSNVLLNATSEKVGEDMANDLIRFIFTVEKQARKDERDKVVSEAMYIATEALANGGDLDTVLDGMKTLLNKLSNNN